MKMSGVLAAIGAAAMAGAAWAQPQVVYNSNGFESPGYVVGPLAGQQGYFFQGLTTLCTVQNTTFQAGSQAVQLDADNLTLASAWFWTDTPFIMGTNGNSVLEVSWHMRVSQPGPNPGAFGIDMYQNNPFDRILAMYVGANAGGDQIAYILQGAAAAVNTGASVTFGQWHLFQIIINFATGKMDIKLDGVTIAAGVSLPPTISPATEYTDSDIWALGGGGDNMAFYDNLKVEAKAAAAQCYPDCNGDNLLNLADFGCFQTKFALQDPYADCNGDGVLNLADFGCFQTKFALGCP